MSATTFSFSDKPARFRKPAPISLHRVYPVTARLVHAKTRRLNCQAHRTDRPTAGGHRATEQERSANGMQANAAGGPAQLEANQPAGPGNTNGSGDIMNRTVSATPTLISGAETTTCTRQRQPPALLTGRDPRRHRRRRGVRWPALRLPRAIDHRDRRLMPGSHPSSRTPNGLTPDADGGQPLAAAERGRPRGW